jgi:hypothetical protein
VPVRTFRVWWISVPGKGPGEPPVLAVCGEDSGCVFGPVRAVEKESRWFGTHFLHGECELVDLLIAWRDAPGEPITDALYNPHRLLKVTKASRHFLGLAGPGTRKRLQWYVCNWEQPLAAFLGENLGASFCCHARPINCDHRLVLPPEVAVHLFAAQTFTPPAVATPCVKESRWVQEIDSRKLKANARSRQAGTRSKKSL